MAFALEVGGCSRTGVRCEAEETTMTNHHKQTSALGGVIDEAEAFVAATAEMGEDKLVDYVHANPWQAIGVAAGAGVVAGVLVGAVAFRR
jgi:predicted ABC-type sugar transport system permease subunit